MIKLTFHRSKIARSRNAVTMSLTCFFLFSSSLFSSYTSSFDWGTTDTMPFAKTDRAFLRNNCNKHCVFNRISRHNTKQKIIIHVWFTSSIISGLLHQYTLHGVQGVADLSKIIMLKYAFHHYLTCINFFWWCQSTVANFI